MSTLFQKPTRLASGAALLLLAALLPLAGACTGAGPSRIAFVSSADGDSEIVLLEPGTGETTRLTNQGPKYSHPRWSPDRERLAYVSQEEGVAAINVFDLSENSVHRLSGTEGVQGAPLWSPDGGRVAYVSGRDGNGEVYVIDDQGGDAARLTFTPQDERLGDWSPDGEWLVFWAEGPEAEPGLWLRNPSGVNLVPLTDGNDRDPSWSPNGERLAFVRTEGGNTDVYLVRDPAGEVWRDKPPPVRLTRSMAEDLSPVWSPDSKTLAFVSYADGNAEIYTMRGDGAQRRRLTSNDEDDHSPAWSPEGQHLAFVSHLYGAPEIFTMRADGREQRRATSNDVADENPDW